MTERERFPNPNARATSAPAGSKAPATIEAVLAVMWRVLRNFPEARIAVAAAFGEEREKEKLRNDHE